MRTSDFPVRPVCKETFGDGNAPAFDRNDVFPRRNDGWRNLARIRIVAHDLTEQHIIAGRNGFLLAEFAPRVVHAVDIHVIRAPLR